MAERKLTQERKDLIRQAAKSIGLLGKVKRKKLIREHLLSGPDRDKFAGMTDRNFNKIIDIKFLVELAKEEAGTITKEEDDTITDTITAGYSNEEITDRLAFECAKYGLPVEAVSSYKFVNHQGQAALNIAFHPQFQKQVQSNETIIEAMNSEIKPYRPKKVQQKNIDKKLCNQYTLTDYHLGMLAWGEETGSDWNTNLAEEILIKWFAKGIELSPNANKAIFANIGDFMHWDGLDAVTPMNKHVLDADTRFGKLVRVAIRSMRKIITMLLDKYPSVHIIHAEGNHDLASSVWLREVFRAFYENEPRVTVEDRPDPYYNFMWGKTCLFYHHTHLKGIKQLDTVFVAKFREAFGRAKHVYAHTGHLHHDKVLETNLMKIEQHRTLSAKDAYASRGGYMSGRDSKVITYHKEFGEVGRQTINPQMLE